MEILIRRINEVILLDKMNAPYFESLKMDKPPYNFKKITIEDQFADCIGEDFNKDLTFNVDKYNQRKTKEATLIRINDLKKKLKDTDYIALKAFEGSISEAEFEPIKNQREEWRKEIDALLKQI